MIVWSRENWESDQNDSQPDLSFEDESWIKKPLPNEVLEMIAKVQCKHDRENFKSEAIIKTKDNEIGAMNNKIDRLKKKLVDTQKRSMNLEHRRDDSSEGDDEESKNTRPRKMVRKKISTNPNLFPHFDELEVSDTSGERGINELGTRRSKFRQNK